MAGSQSVSASATVCVLATRQRQGGSLVEVRCMLRQEVGRRPLSGPGSRPSIAASPRALVLSWQLLVAAGTAVLAMHSKQSQSGF